MLRYIVVSIVGGILFGILDGLINANPLAQRLYEVYKPIARTSVNALAGITIDLVYGFVMAAVFLLLYKSLPGETGFVKGSSFAFLVWFFRVVMYGVSQWMMFKVSIGTLLYTCLLPTSPFSATFCGLPPYIWRISLAKPLYVAVQKRCG